MNASECLSFITIYFSSLLTRCQLLIHPVKMIDKYRSYEDYSWITIRKVLNFYGYKTHKRKPKAVGEIRDILEYMINNEMIEIAQDLDAASYDTAIEIKIQYVLL